MVRVPVYERQIGASGLPGARVSPVDVSSGQASIAEGFAGVGRTVAHAADIVGKIQAQTRAEVDTAMAQSARAELARARRELLEDPQAGYFRFKGGKAKSEYKSVETAYEAKLRQIKGGLSARQAAMFQEDADRDAEAFRGAAGAHLTKETETFATQAHESLVSSAVTDGIGAALRNDGRGLEFALVSGGKAIEERAQVLGWDDVVAASQRRAFQSTLYLGTVEALMDQGRNVEASQLLAAKRGDIDETMIREQKLDQVLAAATLRDNARSVGDTLWEEAGGDPVKADELLRAKGLGTELYDETSKRITQRTAQAGALRREADDPRMGRLEQRMRLDGAFSLQDDDYVRLSDEGKGTMLRWRDAERREARKEQSEIDANAAAHYGARPLYAQPGVDQVSVDIGREYADASARQRDKLRAQQQDVAKLGERQVPMEDINRRATAETKALRIKGARAAEFNAYLQDLFVEWAQDPKNQGRKAPSPEVVDGWFRAGLLRGETPGVLYGTNELWGFEAARQGKPFTPMVQQPTRDTPGGGRAPPDAAGVPVSAPASPKRPQRTVNGQVREWDGQRWVPVR